MSRILLTLIATSLIGSAVIAGCSSDDSSSAEQAGGAGGSDQDASQQGGGAGTQQTGGSAGSAGAAGAEAGGPCEPDPCDTSENQAAHRTQCKESTTEPSGHVCVCSTGFHDDGGLCCSSNGSNVGGACKCNADYVDAKQDGVCVAACTENTIEGLSGWCADGTVCVQGKCVTDACIGVACPKDAECVQKNGAGFCECADGLHMSNGICCKEHASNVAGACQCDGGYHDSAGTCVADAGNKCVGVNPCKELHKNVCVPDTTAAGYHCECNENYVPAQGGTGCTLETVSDCGAGFACENNYCVPVNGIEEQCVTDADCHEFDPTAKTTCNPAAAGGICLGCQVNSDCPGNTQCTSYNTCALLCDTDSDCPYGVCHSTGYCVQNKCTSNDDCYPGTICNNEANDPSGGMCQRPRCTTTACGSSNPNGTCPNAGESCINGECVSGCSPNPCVEINKTQCALSGGKPTCSCVPGTSLDSNGKCAPDKVAQCPTSFVCEGGRCVDDSVTGFQCGTSSDCGVPMNCSNALPAGTCYGCQAGFTCPTGSTCVSDYCLRPCTGASDCATGMVCYSGYCGKKDCMSPSDCPANYTCGTSGRCERLPCQ